MEEYNGSIWWEYQVYLDYEGWAAVGHLKNRRELYEKGTTYEKQLKKEASWYTWGTETQSD